MRLKSDLVSIKPHKNIPNFSVFLSQILLKSTFVSPGEKIPFYPFFSDLVQLVLKASRRSGFPPKACLREIKKAFVDEQKFKQNLRALNRESYLQFALLIMLTWVMILFTEYMELAKVGIFFKGIIFFLQLICLILYRSLFPVIERRKLEFTQVFIKKIMTFQIAIQTHTPLQQALEQANFKSLFDKSGSNYTVVLEKLSAILSLFQQRGGNLLEELALIQEELWDIYSLNLVELEKACKILRFFLIFCFLIPGYFCYLFALIFSLIHVV